MATHPTATFMNRQDACSTKTKFLVEQASCLLLNAKQKGQRINSLPFLCFKVTFKWFKPLILRYLFYGTGQNRTAVQNGY
jgi:hypothetical protein